MTLTTIATHIEPAAPAVLDAALEVPFALAAAHGAQLTALVFPIETALAEASTPSWELAEREEGAAARVRATAERRGIRCEVRTRSSFAYGTSEVMADHLRVSDLGLLTMKGAPGAGQRILIGAAIFDSGRPVLLVPGGAQRMVPPARIVVAWDATPAAVRAVHGALPFMRAAAETLVVTVTDDKELRPGQSGIQLCHLLARHGARASFAAVQRDGRGVLEVLAATAGEGALLVMGAVRHAPIRNLVLGSATRDVLEAGPPMPVLLAA
ncbi:universal stress protein [Falsiroseomonas oryziterrae]|uniref:universal stress protein n=1 Tax=Falsiroseomonas oryziterrae TaxID=2911368 RepID=UPI001F3536DE|nr:universal stress protein [Roseomonas sp. NPKOSM-4]